MDVGEGIHGSVVSPNELGELFHTSAALVLDDTFGCILRTGGDEELVRRAKDLVTTLSSADRVRMQPDEVDAGLWYQAQRATEVVACAFERDRAGARAALRRAWCSTLPEKKRMQVQEWAERSALRGARLLAIWCRNVKYESYRNMSPEVVQQLVELAAGLDLKVCLFGNELYMNAKGLIDCCHLWKSFPFDDDLSLRSQLYLFDVLLEQGNLVASVGAKSGVMDGPALLGVKTLYLENVEDKRRQRMELWLRRVPWYERVQCQEFARENSVYSGALMPDELRSVKEYVRRCIDTVRAG